MAANGATRAPWLRLTWHLVRAVLRPTGPVQQSRQPLLLVPGQPPMQRLPANPPLRRHLRDGPSLPNYR
jgi:hypothetical protein